MTIGTLLFFTVASLVIIIIGVAGFGVSELAREALRTGVAPGREQVTQDRMPKEFSRSVTLCFILGNALYITCAAAAIAVCLSLYRLAQ